MPALQFASLPNSYSSTTGSHIGHSPWNELRVVTPDESISALTYQQYTTADTKTVGIGLERQNTSVQKILPKTMKDPAVKAPMVGPENAAISGGVVLFARSPAESPP